MKKLLSAITISVLILMLCACTTTDGQIKAGTPFSPEGAEIQEGSAGMTLPPKPLSELQKDYTLEETIVFRGVVEGLRTPIEVYCKWQKKYLPEYCETKLRVLDAYYGDVQTGDLITHYEDIRPIDTGEKKVLMTLDGRPPIETGKEFIFILSKMDGTSSDGTPLYDGITTNYYSDPEMYDTFKTKVQEKTAHEQELFDYEVLDYYLHQPETKLDLRKEASKYLENIPENATDQEILQALPQEKKDLFERMIDQYGSVERQD